MKKTSIMFAAVVAVAGFESVAESDLGGVQLWENGPYWAECNVGASSPEGCGYYFWWGDTIGYKRNSANNGWMSVKDGSSFSFNSGNCPTYGKNNSQLQSAGYIDATGNLAAKYDAATVHLGGSWRVPTEAEISALSNNCDTEWTSRNGVLGRLVRGRGAYASKSIFLPAVGYGYDSSIYGLGSDGEGYYWSSTPHSDYSDSAWNLEFMEVYSFTGYFGRGRSGRNNGFSIRPVRVSVVTTITLGTALDNSNLSFSSGGNASWFGQAAVSHDGTDAARSGAINDNQTSSMQTTVSGAGTVSFWWKVSSESGYDKLHFYVDGAEVVSAISGSTSWAQVSQTLGAGSHTLKWEYSKDSSQSSGDDCGWVDQVVWTPTSTYTVTFNANGGSCSTSSKQYSSGSTLGTLPTATRSGYTFDGWYTSSSGGTKVSSSTTVTGNVTYYAHWSVSGSGVALTTALNVSGISFSNGGNASWFGQTAVSHDGSSAARSGQIGASQSSAMQTTVTGPADISFWWKVSSESVSYDYLEFLIDNDQKDKIGGTGGSWAQKTYSIGGGSHTLKWNYRKDGSVDGGDDCGWVDQLVVTPKTTPSDPLAQNGLVAWYKFDGSLSDASGNGYDMAGTCGGYVQGQGSAGQALSCAGFTAVCPAKRIEVESSFTISCWLKADEDIAVVAESSSGIKTNGKMVLTPGQCGTYGAGGGAGIGFAYGKNGVAVYEHGASYLPVVLMHSANVGTGWNHVVITVSNDNAPMLYINGDFVRQGVKGARTHRCVMLGKDCSTIGGEFYGNRFNGCADDFRIYNRALSATEVKAVYEGDDGVASWSGKSITPSAWVASDNNVLKGLEGTFSGSRYYESGRVSTSDPLSRLTDGMVNASGSTYGNTVGITSGTLTWQLACPVDLNGLRINTHWCDGGRDGINLTSVEIQQGGSSVWTALPNSSFSFGMNDNDTSGDLEIIYANASNSVFADGVTAIRFNLGTQDNTGSGFTEFEAIGVATAGGDLVHRWSFNGNLIDSVGGQTATAVGSVTTDGKQYTLAGGSRGSSYINLGSNILPNDGSGVTLEVWGTQKSVRKCGRIWDIGGNTSTDMLMAWTCQSDINADGICIRQIGGDQLAKLSPYTLGTEFHVATVFKPQADGTWKVYYYKQDASTGATLASATLDSKGTSWSLTTQNQTDCWLGHSHWSDNNDANASYNEVRVWKRALTEAELTANAILGPNVLPGGSVVPGASTYTVTFNANGGSCSTSSKQYTGGLILGTLPTATRSGYELDGWYTSSSGGTKVSSSTVVTRAVTYYAHWTKVVTYCEVAFDVNGGEGGMTWRDVEMGKSVGTLPSPVRSKHKFLGWYTQRDGGTKISSSTKVMSDVTYYAHWQYDGSVYVQTVLSEYSEGMGTVSGGNKSVKGGSSVTLTAKAAKGCVFSRWYPVGVSDEEWDEFWNTHEIYNPSLKIQAGSEDRIFEARFVPVEWDRLYIPGFDEWHDNVGELLNEPTSDWDSDRCVSSGGESESLVKFTVSGVPTGVKYKTHNQVLFFYGKPTKEGVYWVTYTAKNASGYKATSVIKWTIGNPKPTDYDNIGLNKQSDDWKQMCNLLVGGEIGDSLCVDNWNSGCAYCGDGEITKWAISGLPTGLKLQQNCHGRYVITGMPTKAGKFTMTITATYADKHTAKAVQTIVVEDYGSAYVKVAVTPGQEYMGSASGGGVCARASKAKLTAKANKGYVFAGWYDEDGNRWRNTDSGDWRKASDSYIVRLDEWPEFYARFVPGSSDQSISIRCPSEWNVDCSDVGNLLYDACSFDVDSASLPTVTASGLPSGCKFDKVNMRLVFEKQPQKPGISKVTIKAKNVSGATDEKVIYVKVPNLRSDVFDGIDYERDYRVPQYDSMVCLSCWLSFSVQSGWTVTASGLPSGLKLVKDDCGYGSFMRVVGTATKAGAYTVTLTAKRGGVSEKATFTIIVDPLPSYAIGTFNGVLSGECYYCGVSRGTFTMTSTSSGKLSATLVTELGEKYTFSANSWSCISDEECSAYFTKKVKSDCWSGEQYIFVTVRRDGAWDGYQLTGDFLVDACRVGGGGEIVAQRNPFGKVGSTYENWEAHSIAATLAEYGKMGVLVEGGGDGDWGEYEFACLNCVPWDYWGPPKPDLTFTVAVDGTVKVAGKIAGKSVSGSSKLRIIDGEPQADFMFSVSKTPISIHVGFELEYGANGAAYGSARVGW